jgi:hypothetical protein
MKKLALAAIALGSAASVFAQGTIQFNNRNPAGTSHIYAPLPGAPGTNQIGNGSADSPSGSTSWAGFSGIGLNGFTGQYGGSTTLAQLLGANGSGDAEASLTPQSGTITFRTGAAAAGFLYLGPTVTLSSIPLDSAAATFQVVAWDDSSGLYSTWTLASAAWSSGLIAAGESTVFTVANIGGNVNTPPSTGFTSFNLYVVPEPSTFALAGLGAAAMLIFRRRKR